MVGAIFELSDEKFGIVARLIVVRQSRCMQDAAFAAADDLVKSSRQRRRALRRYSHTPWNTCVPALRGSTTISSRTKPTRSPASRGKRCCIENWRAHC